MPSIQPISSSASLGALLVLDARVEILRVLADEDEIDVVEPAPHALVALAGPNLAVEVERLPQPDVHRAEAAADRGRDRPLQRDARLANRIEDPIGQRIAVVLVHHVRSGVLDVPVELGSARLQHSACRLG